MRFLFTILAYLFLICLSGCANSNTVVQKEAQTIEFSEIRPDSLVGFPVSVHSIGDDSIIINDNKNNEHISLFSLTNGHRLYSTGLTGAGPGEVIPPIRVTVSDDSIYVLSLPAKVLLSGSINENLLNFRVRMPKEVMGLYYLPRHKIFITPVMSLDNTIDKNTYAYVYDYNFNKIQELKGFAQLWEKEKTFPADVLNKFHQIQGICETDDGKIAVLESHVLRIYTYDGEKLALYSDKQLFPYEYSFTARTNNNLLPTTRLTEGIIKGCRDIASRNNTILISVDTDVKGGVSSGNHVKLLHMDSDGSLIGEYIANVQLNPYPLTVTKSGRIVMFSEGEDLSIALSSYPKP